MRRGAVVTEKFVFGESSEEGEDVMTIKRRGITASMGWRLAVLGLPVAARPGRHARGSQEARHVPRRRHPGAALVLQGSQDRRVVVGARHLDGQGDGRQTLGVKMETVEVSWGNSIAALQGDKIDIMFTIDATPERKQAVDFPESPLLYYSLAVLARDDLDGEDLGGPQQARRAHRRAAGLVDGLAS